MEVPLLVAESNGKVNKKLKWFAKKWTNDEQNHLTSTTDLHSMAFPFKATATNYIIDSVLKI